MESRLPRRAERRGRQRLSVVRSSSGRDRWWRHLVRAAVLQRAERTRRTACSGSGHRPHSPSCGAGETSAVILPRENVPKIFGREGFGGQPIGSAMAWCRSGAMCSGRQAEWRRFADGHRLSSDRRRQPGHGASDGTALAVPDAGRRIGTRVKMVVHGQATSGGTIPMTSVHRSWNGRHTSTKQMRARAVGMSGAGLAARSRRTDPVGPGGYRKAGQARLRQSLAFGA